MDHLPKYVNGGSLKEESDANFRSWSGYGQKCRDQKCEGKYHNIKYIHSIKSHCVAALYQGYIYECWKFAIRIDLFILLMWHVRGIIIKYL